MPQEPLPESSPVNILVDLLLRFPEIYTITLNLPSATCSLTYMVRRKLGRGEHPGLERRIRESLKTFFYLNRYRYKAKEQIKLSRKQYHDLTQLSIVLRYDFLLGDTISLLTALMRDLFQDDLITEDRTGSGTRRPVRELIEESAPVPEALARCRSSRLVAFRDAGKVYIFDK
ncbi:MAG: hypothetical protein ACOX30_06335 [Dethiobacteria bacterium]|jgi:hypothetical protein